jgi:ferritin-like metal-binding protein YciE
MKTLNDFFVTELQDLYDAEQQILKALPKMVEAATHEDLKDAFAEHLTQTEEHVARLEEVCKNLDIKPKGKSCKGMEGVIEEGKELLKEEDPSPVLDAALISAAQHVEHYEIAGYGCAITYAKLLGLDDEAEILEETLNEEEETDELLSDLAEKVINKDAL